MRGQASALYLFMLNFIGLGICPTAVGWLTDYVFKDELQIGYSLLAVGVTAHIIGGADHFFAGSHDQLAQTLAGIIR